MPSAAADAADARPDISNAASAAHGGAKGCIGPNAITQVLDTLQDTLGIAVCQDILGEAGLERLCEDRPDTMVDEQDVVRLHRHVRRSLGGDAADPILAEAGRRTGHYILRNRIPKPAQALLRALPGRMAAPLLLLAIAKHAWTFAGTGAFSWQLTRQGAMITLNDCPACSNVYPVGTACAYYGATLETLFRALVSPGSTVHDTFGDHGQSRHFALTLTA